MKRQDSGITKGQHPCNNIVNTIDNTIKTKRLRIGFFPKFLFAPLIFVLIFLLIVMPALMLLAVFPAAVALDNTDNTRETYNEFNAFSTYNAYNAYTAYTAYNTYNAYSADGATDADGSQTVKVGDTVTLPFYTRVGYSHLGFSENPDAVTPDYPASFVMDRDDFDALFGANSTATLYTVWEKKQYTIHFEANGGDGIASPQIANIGDLIYIPSAFTRENYEMTGLDVRRTADSASYPGKAFRLDEAAIIKIFANDAVSEGVLYALWRPAETDVEQDSPSPPPVESPTASPAESPSDTPQPEEPVEPTIEPTDPPEESPADTPQPEEPPEPQTFQHEQSESFIVFVKPGAQPSDEPLSITEQLREAGVIVFEIGDTELAAFGYPEMAVWALLNLILCATGVVLAAVTIIRARIYSRRERGLFRAGWLTVATIAGVVGVSLFPLTENMSHQVVLADKWSIIFAGVFICEIIAISLVIKRVKK